MVCHKVQASYWEHVNLHLATISFKIYHFLLSLLFYKLCKCCDVNLVVYAGTKLLNHVLDLCSKQNISEVYLHVQTNNEDAINFYKKFGFEITETIQNYYTNITPPDCYVLTRYTASTTKK